MNCEKESSKETIQTPCNMYHKYLPVNVYANLQIDLNFDGIENIDLTKEIDAFRDSYIYFTDEEVIIAWPEPQIDQVPFLTQELPYVHTGQDIRYIVVPRHYTYSVTYRKYDTHTWTWIYPVEIKEEGQQNHYTFTGPIYMEVNEEQNTITLFHSYQYFLTEKGKTGRIITAAIFKIS